MNFNEITIIIIYDSDDSHLNIRLWEYKTSRNPLFLFLRILLFQLLPLLISTRPGSVICGGVPSSDETATLPTSHPIIPSHPPSSSTANHQQTNNHHRIQRILIILVRPHHRSAIQPSFSGITTGIPRPSCNHPPLLPLFHCSARAWGFQGFSNYENLMENQLSSLVQDSCVPLRSSASPSTQQLWQSIRSYTAKQSSIEWSHFNAAAVESVGDWQQSIFNNRECRVAEDGRHAWRTHYYNSVLSSLSLVHLVCHSHSHSHSHGEQFNGKQFIVVRILLSVTNLIYFPL